MDNETAPSQGAPEMSRLEIPTGYAAALCEGELLTWSQVVGRIEQEPNHWFATTRPAYLVRNE